MYELLECLYCKPQKCSPKITQNPKCLLNRLPAAVLGREAPLPVPLFGEDHFLVAAPHAEHRAHQSDGEHDEGDADAQDGAVRLPHAPAGGLAGGLLIRFSCQVQLEERVRERGDYEQQRSLGLFGGFHI